MDRISESTAFYVTIRVARGKLDFAALYDSRNRPLHLAGLSSSADT